MTKILLIIALFSTYILMVFGGIVTSTGSGLGCPDWPLCYGTFNPPPKMDAWIEWIHRLLGANAGFFILLSFISVWKNYRGLPRITIGVALGMLFVVVLLGGVVVLREAPLLSEAEHIILTSSHVIISTIILTFIAFTLSIIVHEAKGSPFNVPYAIPLFFLLYAQIIVGIIVRYTQSGLACPDWPTCMGHIIPPFDTFNVFIHFLHRILAYALVILVGYILFKDLNPRTGVTFSLVVAQMLFGIMSIFSGLFLPIVFHHIAIGFFLLAWTAYISAPYIFAKGVHGEIKA